jgi:hypothetical protein
MHANVVCKTACKGICGKEKKFGYNPSSIVRVFLGRKGY